jgi:nucleotide-binding universal stress UspA family protein
MLDWTRTCCATDFSEPSRLAMLKACELVRRLGGELELVHVEPRPPAVATDMLVTTAELGLETGAEVRGAMEAWTREAEAVLGRPVRAEVVPGDPATELLRLARERAFDLVVLGSHGRKGLSRLVLGSVAERVVRHAPCTVLVVRRREPARETTNVVDLEAYA